MGWFVRTPDPQSFLGSSVFRPQVSVPITLLQVLAVDVGSSDLNHLKVDVPVPDIDPRHGPSIAVFDLGFQGYGLPLDQSLQGLGGPLAAVPLTCFRGIDAGKADRDLVPLTTGYTDGVTITD